MTSGQNQTPKPLGRARLRSFHDLMQRRISRILLISSLYDSFILSEEGHVHEALLSHFLDLNLSHFPDIVQVPSAAAGLEHLERGSTFDLVVSSINTGSGNVVELAHQLREAGHEMPVIALAYANRDLHELVAENDTSVLERIFLWQGDVRILMAMVKYLEDRLNVEIDSGLNGVPAIILVEDNIRFYSSFLPTIYAELFQHTHRLLSEGLNLSQKMLRMRARPKVLLCESYEEAWDYFERYEEQTIGVVSDFEFPRGGRIAKQAGLELCRQVLDRRSDVRIVLQSSIPSNRVLAEELGASFLLKGSPVLLRQLRKVLVERFGFGDFAFRLPSGREIGRAHDLESLAQKLGAVPAESVVYHAERNHFSNWLKARGEFELAQRLRPRRLEEFESTEHLRRHVLEMIATSRAERNRSLIADFDRRRFDPAVSITRLGGGALGGKARGIAFANRILSESDLSERFGDIDVNVPPSVVLGTEIFDAFLDYDRLREYSMSASSDQEVFKRFQDAPFPRAAVADLRAFVERVRHPLAVRSSSLLEDSLAQPFAGVYETYMLPNNDPDIDVRLEQLKSAIKRVYASTFTQRAKSYLSMTSFRLEEEKMAVMIQRLVGLPRGDSFYPDFSGVARSYSFYPEPGQEAEDGVVALALGMGQAVVDGSPVLRFCPRHPRKIVSFSSVPDALENSQREFYALDLGRATRHAGLLGVRRQPLEVAERDGALAWSGSTYSAENNVVVDGISRPGIRLVTFAQVLKHRVFPMAELLRFLLEESAKGTGGPVEIEFAGNLRPPAGERPSFAFLQLRPLALSMERDQVKIGEVDDAQLLCRASQVLGNGLVDDLCDLVVVDINSFERLKSHEAAQQVARFDAILRKEERPYLLIGVGRWGSADPHLGIPVAWNQICGARVIVEAGFRDFKVAPSQGTHFFQNLTSSNTGYFTVNPDVGEGYLDWDWLAGIEALNETEFVRHLRLGEPLVVKMDGTAGQGVILKPG